MEDDSNSSTSSSLTSSLSEAETDCWQASLDFCANPSGGDQKRQRLSECEDFGRSSGFCVPVIAQSGCFSEDTLIIFDWDDTLSPSTWLQQQGLKVADGSAVPNDKRKEELKRVGQCVSRTLQHAKCLGTVIIVTNADKGWVELCCAKFFPEVLPLLEGIKVKYSRTAFENGSCPDNPALWKYPSFRQEIAAFSQMTPHDTSAGHRKHMISLGDSMQERSALMEATSGLDCWTKSLKFMVRPSLEQFLKQHELLYTRLRPFACFEGNLDLRLKVPKCK